MGRSIEPPRSTPEELAAAAFDWRDARMHEGARLTHDLQLCIVALVLASGNCVTVSDDLLRGIGQGHRLVTERDERTQTTTYRVEVTDA